MTAWVKLAIAAVIFGLGLTANGWRLGTEIAKLERDHTQAVSDAATAGARALARMTEDRDRKAIDLTVAADANRTKSRKAENETNRLRTCIADGTCGLRIRATCDTTTPQDPGAATGPGVDTGGGARLDPAAGRAYTALREGIDHTQEVLRACQSELRIRANP